MTEDEMYRFTLNLMQLMNDQCKSEVAMKKVFDLLSQLVKLRFVLSP